MKKMGFITILVLVLFAPLLAQNTSHIEKFVGGHLNLNLGLTSSSLSVLHSGRFSPSNSYLAWMDFSSNPAFSTGIQNPSVTYFFAPPVTLHPEKIVDVNSRVRRSIDAGIEGFRSDSLNPVYPDLSNSFRKNRYWGEGLVSFPAGGVVFTLGFTKELSLNFQSLMTGAETTISTEVPFSEGTSRVVFNAFLDANLSFHFDLDKTTVGIAKIIRNYFALGFSLNRYGGCVQASGFADAQGDMLFNGHEFIFNNPNDNWHNALNQSLQGKFKGSSWRMNWGGWYLLNGHFILDGVLSLQTPLTLNGELVLQTNKIPALNVNALSSDDPDAEILDPTKLNLS